MLWYKKEEMLFQVNNITHLHLLKHKHSHELPLFIHPVSYFSYSMKIVDKVSSISHSEYFLKEIIYQINDKYYGLRWEAQQVSNENYN